MSTAFMNTASNRCVYINCKSNTRKNKHVRFFKFPIKNVPRSEEWKKNCGNINIALMEVNRLGRKLICDKHFLPSDFIKNNKRTLLKKSAVPIKFIEENRPQSPVFALPSTSHALKTYAPKAAKRKRHNSLNSKPTPITPSSDESDAETIKLINSNSLPRVSSFMSSCSDESKLSERILQMEDSSKTILAKKCKLFSVKIKALRKKSKYSQIYHSSKKKSSFSVCGVLSDFLRNKSESVKTFVNMQLFHKNKGLWSKKEKQLALSIHYKSPSAYKFMLYKLKFVLPAITTIQKWLRIINLKTGINTSVTKKLFLKANVMNEAEKKCVVMFDEIALKPKLEYNEKQDIIEGHQDLGYLGRQPIGCLFPPWEVKRKQLLRKTKVTMGFGGKDINTEEYICSLSETLQEVALKELREDDCIRQQSLQQMREWIAKHPSIKYCRTDACFLLRFLRTKKFSVPLACEMLERYLIIRQLYPHWFRDLDCNDNDLAELIDTGYIVPLLERHNGKVIIFTSADRFDPYKFTAAHMIKVHSLVTEALMEDEANQINGYIYVNDVAGFQMGHISLWSLKDIRNIVRCVQNSSPMRHKENHLLNVSTYTAKLVEFAKSIMSEKLSNRTFVNKTVGDLQEKIDIKILPKEYGGEVPIADMIKDFKMKLQESRDRLIGLNDLHIEIDEKNCNLLTEMNEQLGIGIEGSFKKLQVD